MLAPSEGNRQLEPTVQVRELLREYYFTKHMLRKDLLETLETQKNARPAVLGLKNKNFKAALYSHQVSLEMQKTRLLAESGRLRQYQQSAAQGGLLYYRVLKRLCAEKVAVTPATRFVMDYCRIVVEHGLLFGARHLQTAVQRLTPQEKHEPGVAE